MNAISPFGTVLREIRTARGISQGTLAKRTHYSKGYLSRVENGLQQPSVMLARQCDAVLEAGGRLISLAVASTPGNQGSTSDGSGDDAEVWVLEMANDGSVWFRPMARRQVLASGVALLTTTCLPTANSLSRAQQAGAVDRFTAMFGELRRMGQQVSPRFVLPTLVAQTHTLRGMAKDAGPDARARLLRLASRYAEYTGWMAQESGQDAAALWWTEQAADMAAAGGDQDMTAYSLVRRALVTLYADDAPQTVALARQAQRDRSASDRVRGLAAQREAQGHALAGAATECLHALDRSAELLSRGADERDGPVLGTSTVANPVMLTRAWCLHDLGRTAEAADLMDRELRAVGPDATRFQARWGARRALAYARSGEIDHACDLAAELLPRCVAADSATIRADIRDLGRTLSRWLGHSRVQAVYPAVVDAMRGVTISTW
ncbi:MAG TPA: helix-turn-helix transcriptional regulator [Pseudonocardiaceae bacterium]|nr:helix-turn-helix transcriptional regulator [Pseudonocardiaceae bacterium]